MSKTLDTEGPRFIGVSELGTSVIGAGSQELVPWESEGSFRIGTGSNPGGVRWWLWVEGKAVGVDSARRSRNRRAKKPKAER